MRLSPISILLQRGLLHYNDFSKSDRHAGCPSDSIWRVYGLMYSTYGEIFMNITVQLKYYHQTVVGKEELQVQLQGGGTLGDLIYRLKEIVPELFPEAENAKFTVNGRFADPDTVLAEGSKVNMLTPMTGG